MSLPPKLLSFVVLTILGGAAALATSDHPLVDRTLSLLQAKRVAVAAAASAPGKRVVAAARSPASNPTWGLSQLTGATLAA
ncbi:MAG: hypothetical protein ABWY94_07505, partial [Pseudoxanthomonas sp.]